MSFSMSNTIKTEDEPVYLTASNDNAIIERALDILRSRLREPGEAMTSPTTVKNYLTLRLADREHEVFSVLFLDTRHRVLAFEEMFRGTIDGASVHPREVVRQALAHNAAAVIFSHNHPSGVAEPSQADRHITERLRDALELVDVWVLDHIIIGGMDSVSLAERGLI